MGKMSCVGTVLRFDEGMGKFFLFDLRIPPPVNPEQVVEEFKVKAYAYGMEVVDTEITRGYLRDLTSPCIQTLLSAYREITDGKEKPYVMGGNTYARFLPTE